MNSRKLVLLVASLLAIVIFLSIGSNKAWLDERILVFNDEVYEHIDHMSIADRRMMRWGNPYVACSSINDYMKKEKIKNALILMPPASYSEKFTQKVVLPEPVVCYLFAGIRTTTINSKDVYKANYCVVSSRGNMEFNKLKDSTEVANMIKEYKSVK